MAISLASFEVPGLNAIPGVRDFTFVLNEREFQYFTAFACVLSPAVARMVRTDATFNVMHLDVVCRHEVFEKILEIPVGRTLEIDNDNVMEVLAVSAKLENTVMSDACWRIVQNSVSVERVFDMIEALRESGFPTDVCTEFIAANFEQLAVSEKLRSLDSETLVAVLSSPALKVPGQGWLFTWIMKMKKECGMAYDVLIECLDFDQLSTKEIVSILEMTDDVSVTADVIRKLRAYLIAALGDARMSRIAFKAELESGKELCGVFEKLWTQTGQNPIDAQLVSISVPVNPELSINLIDYHENLNSHWKNNCEKEENWILFDLKRYRLKMSAYTIRGCYCEEFHCRPKQWLISGSNDRRSWTTLSSVRPPASQIMDRVYGIGSVTVNSSEAYQFIKFTQIESWDPNLKHIIHLSAIEFFGTVYRLE